MDYSSPVALLCDSSGDKEKVRELFQRLSADASGAGVGFEPAENGEEHGGRGPNGLALGRSGGHCPAVSAGRGSAVVLNARTLDAAQ